MEERKEKIIQLTFNNTQEIKDASLMLMAMYHELQSDKSSKNLDIYKGMIINYIRNDYVLYYKQGKGIFVMHDENIPALPDYQTWSGTVVYIKPEYRKTRVLKDMYNYMFRHFKGVIMGYTEANSEHNKVLMKRDKLLGYVYNIRRK